MRRSGYTMKSTAEKFFLTAASVLVACMLLISLSEVEQAEASSSLNISEDEANGRITVENDKVKTVWHYKTLRSESNNQSGGNLYELYDKQTDPLLLRNLVSFHSSPYWGNGRTYLWIAVGGIGSTGVYATNELPWSGGNYSFDDLISDNNLSGELQSQHAEIDDAGNAVISFRYKVKSQSTQSKHRPSNGYWYEVEKKWIVEPNGLIKLSVTRTILSNGYFSEPAIRMNWSGESSVGWNRYVKYGRDWSRPDNPLYYRNISDLSEEDGNCWNNFNRFHPDWIAMTGSEIAPSVKVIADNNGLGFTGSGSYNLGKSIWGRGAGSSLEQCSYRRQQVSSYGIGWYAWWGGNPPAEDRYKFMAAGTSWTDTFKIELTRSIADTGPVISNVDVQTIDSESALFSWTTDVDSDSAVQLRLGNGSWNISGEDNSLTKNHSVVVRGLSPDVSYDYQVSSRDNKGDTTIKSKSDFRLTRTETPFNLTVNIREAYWMNYSNFSSGLLSVDFEVKNFGPEDARSLAVTEVISDRGTLAVGSFPIQVSDLATGSSTNATIVYSVPRGIMNFRTSLSLSGTDSSGRQVHFSRLPQN